MQNTTAKIQKQKQTVTVGESHPPLCARTDQTLRDQRGEHHTQPKFTRDALDDLNSPITIKENELIVKIFQKRSPQVQMASLVNSTQHFSKHVIPITRSLLQKAEEERITPTHFMMLALP